ncbi:carbamoyltransferase N-terminal domain-containing protein [Bradyrhizobium sp. 188]|uniref:carbamoyltransferase N-terminal domain-containing protein n=1 Tax=Bradyrhizobium sp. 188 TaxID=2782656 RepID=UPI001FFBFA7A|nr:carbamoyltransferase N-terminal domain-containing protein [Bradyrhizobium sp. 188]MCK1502133.1 nodulation protein [Bradyrhizobium sp. 188]
MFTLGLSGGLDLVHEQRLDAPENYTYDGAAVLLKDGVVVAALEQERLDRIKRSNKFPMGAISFCLRSHGLTLSDLSSIAYYADERAADALLTRMYLARPEFRQRLSARGLLHTTLQRALGCDVELSKLRFYEHKLTHAACAMHQSGFAESLVFVIDNAGGLYAGRRQPDGAVAMETLALTVPAKSIQKLCHAILPFLGLGLFDEYKALAMSMQGNADVFRDAVSRLYDLLPDGDYRLHLDRVPALIDQIEPSRSGVELQQRHYDFAASLQEAMEEIVLHVLSHYRAKTGLRHLCVAGGMAENVEINSSLMYSGLFDEVFVHPIAHDAGCALGAALLSSQDDGMPAPRERVQSVQWGSEPEPGPQVEAELERWRDFVGFERNNDVIRRAAKAIAEGSLVAWLEGRSDFGSHALGSRNVLARTDATEMGERLRLALGRQEVHHRPALLIRDQDIRSWCELPAQYQAVPFQTFTLRVREQRRAEAGAALYANGKAKVQTVSQRQKPRLYRLLGELGLMTGSAAMLSASFNRSSEPTVESVEDAVASFVGSELDYLIVGDFIAERKDVRDEARMRLRISLPPFVQLVRSRGWPERQRRTLRDEMCTTYAPGRRRTITRMLADLLADVESEVPLKDLLSRAEPQHRAELMDEIASLATVGIIVLRPPAVAS